MVESGQHAAHHLRALRFDAGSLALNLVATVGRRYATPVERLTSLDRLHEWLDGVGLEVNAAIGEEDLVRLRHLRERLDELFRSARAHAPPPAVALAEVNTAVARCPPRLSATAAGLALTHPPAATAAALDPVLALIAADAIHILASGDRNNLRTCAADDCQMVYLAHGRRQRRWCSSEHCGNRSRVAAHRARAAVPPPGQESGSHD